MIQRIRFQGQDFLLIGAADKEGAIATEEAYEAFECSYAHLHSDGNISRFGANIGTLADVEFVGGAEDVKEPTMGAVINGIFGSTWKQNG